MVTNWADFRSFFSHYDMTTIAALPYAVAITGEDEFVFDVFKALAVALFVFFFYGCDSLKEFCDFVKAFFSGFLCKGWVHLFPLIGFAVGCVFEAVYCCTYAGENLVPDFSMFFFISCSFCEDV